MPAPIAALRRPAAVWAGLLAAGAVTFAVWLLAYFSDPRHLFLESTGLTTFGAQASRAFAGGTPWLLRLFLLGPWIALATALGASLVAWRAARGSRVAVGLAAASLALPPVVYVLGMDALHQLEDRVFFAKSPWVGAFRLGSLIVGAAAVVCVVWAGVAAWRGRRA